MNEQPCNLPPSLFSDTTRSARHILVKKNAVKRTGVCSICGPTRIQHRGTNRSGSKRWSCSIAVRKNKTSTRGLISGKKHVLVEKNIEARIGICRSCGPVLITFRRKTGRWMCRRFQMLRGLEGKRHELAEKNIEARTAICSVCGPVKLYRASGGKGNPPVYRCAKKEKAARRENRRRTEESRRRDNARKTASKARQVERVYEWASRLCKNACGICGKSEEVACKSMGEHHRSGKRGRGLHLDHDHLTGLVRGLLCGQCNKGLGMLRDSVKLLENAIGYLTMHNALKDHVLFPPVYPLGTKAGRTSEQERALTRVVVNESVEGLVDIIARNDGHLLSIIASI